jgi:hypothetical protein
MRAETRKFLIAGRKADRPVSVFNASDGAAPEGL